MVLGAGSEGGTEGPEQGTALEMASRLALLRGGTPPPNPSPWSLNPGLQGYLAHQKQPPPLEPPEGPRHSPTVGS